MKPKMVLLISACMVLFVGSAALIFGAKTAAVEKIRADYKESIERISASIQSRNAPHKMCAPAMKPEVDAPCLESNATTFNDTDYFTERERVVLPQRSQAIQIKEVDPARTPDATQLALGPAQLSLPVTQPSQPAASGTVGDIDHYSGNIDDNGGADENIVMPQLPYIEHDIGSAIDLGSLEPTLMPELPYTEE